MDGITTLTTTACTPCPLEDVGAAVEAATVPARANPTLVDTKGFGRPPPLKNTES